MNIKERAKKLKLDLPVVYLALKDKDTPIIAKVLAGITIGYALSPIDLIPDFLPVIGYLDDIVLLPILTALTIKAIPKEIWERNRNYAQDIWESNRSNKWLYAIPVIIVWALFVCLIVSAM